MTDDAERIGARKSRALRDRMDMSLGVVMDEPDKAITDETSRVEEDAENGWEDANRAESSMQLAQGSSADRLRAIN
jgi:hypothetical protein